MPLHRGERLLDRGDAVMRELRTEVAADIDVPDLLPGEILRDRAPRELDGYVPARPDQVVVMEHDADAVLRPPAVALERRTVLPAPLERLKRVVRTFQLPAAAMDVRDVEEIRPRRRRGIQGGSRANRQDRRHSDIPNRHCSSSCLSVLKP